jgi:uncharacterized metal-binding protein
MKDKVSLAACNGMGNFGLVARAVTSDLSESKENIISLCIPSIAADDQGPRIIRKYPIIALNGCSNECVNKILENKEADVLITINTWDYADEHGLEAGEVARLGENGEKTVDHLKKHVLKLVKTME